jgi:hypothetical protein
VEQAVALFLKIYATLMNLKVYSYFDNNPQLDPILNLLYRALHAHLLPGISDHNGTSVFISVSLPSHPRRLDHTKIFDDDYK